MEILNQPFNEQLGDRLIGYLDSTKYQSLNIIVAFAKNSGVLRIKDAFERFRKRGGEINVYVGIDLGGTSYEALTVLLPNVDSLHIVHSESGQTFHPKIYNLVGKKESLVIIGSHNLTGGGLWTNVESSVLLPLDMSVKKSKDIQNEVTDYIKNLSTLGKSFMTIRDQGQIEELLKQGYVLPEVFNSVKRRSNGLRREDGSELFGKGFSTQPPSAPPSSTMPSPAASQQYLATDGNGGATLWYSTQAMTGGSANQIDLSKKSLVKKGDPVGTPYETDDPTFMRGSVEFFGIDPQNEQDRRDIRINYDGADYQGNIILFPLGSKRPNRTWRLQFQGKDPSGRAINEAFRAKGGSDYLKYKIVTFTKIKNDYYFMSVFSFSDTRLEEFKEASLLWGHNGRGTNSRPVGIF